MSTHKKKIKIKSKNNTKTKINKNIPKAKKKLKLAKKKETRCSHICCTTCHHLLDLSSGHSQFARTACGGINNLIAVRDQYLNASCHQKQ